MKSAALGPRHEGNGAVTHHSNVVESAKVLEPAASGVDIGPVRCSRLIAGCDRVEKPFDQSKRASMVRAATTEQQLCALESVRGRENGGWPEPTAPLRAAFMPHPFGHPPGRRWARPRHPLPASGQVRPCPGLRRDGIAVLFRIECAAPPSWRNEVADAALRQAAASMISYFEARQKH
jgi:hypothetical protein